MGAIPVLCSLGLLCLALFPLSISGVDLRAEEEIEKRECFGTSVGFSFSGTREYHYRQLQKRFSGCTHVVGNLELTNMDDRKIDYDFSFLKYIRYVSGYILIGLITEVREIPLLSLEVIRGNRTYNIQGDSYSLVVVLTAREDESIVGLTELQMPSLTEIVNGKVLFTENPSLKFINSVDWAPIMRGRWQDVHFMENAFNETAVEPSDSDYVCPDEMQWGKEPIMCQTMTVFYECYEGCDGRCFGTGARDCCHHNCAVGCSGPTEADCTVCKDFWYDEKCVGYCPARSYPKMQNCVMY